MRWKCPECGLTTDYSTIKCVCGYEASGSEEKVEEEKKAIGSRKPAWFYIAIIAAAAAVAIGVNKAFPSLDQHVRWFIAIIGGGMAGWLVDRFASYKKPDVE